MTIAVTAATGQLGRLVLESLKTRTPAANVVALVRSPEKARDLGVEVREADYDRPETFDRALAGDLAELGVPAFACTPDAFPDLLAVALERGDIRAWAAKEELDQRGMDR